MANTYAQLRAELDALNIQIAQALKSERSQAVAQARALIQDFGLTAVELYSVKAPKAPKDSTRANSGSKVAPKYRDPATGATWTGRGKAPKWIDGQDRAQFVIAA